jgi:hypothetical protein
MNQIFSAKAVMSLLTIVNFLAIQSIANAGGDTVFRTAQKTSLYTCSGPIFEMFYEHGNASIAGAGLGLVCFQGYHKARWIIRSAAECDLSDSGNGLCKGNKRFPLKAKVIDFRDLKGTERGQMMKNSYELSKAVMGEFCIIVDEDNEYRWKCQKYSYLGATELETMGTEAMLPFASFYHPKFDPNYTFQNFAGPVSGYYTWTE